MSSNVIKKIFNFAKFKFLNIPYFFVKGIPNFLTPDLKSTIKSSSIKGGQIPKKSMLSSSKSPIKTQETIFEVDIPARVKPYTKSIKLVVHLNFAKTAERSEA